MPFDRAGALRKVFFTGRQLGFDQDNLRSIAAQALGIPSDEFSFSKLSDRQVGALLDHLKGQSTGPVMVRNSATDRQRYLIRQLEKQLGMTENPDRLRGFIRRQTKNRKSNLDELTVFEAGKVIEGLKNLLSHASVAEPQEQVAEAGKQIVHPSVPNLPVRASYTVADLVPHLGLSTQTIHRRIQDGQLKARKAGSVTRIARADLVTYLQSPNVIPIR